MALSYRSHSIPLRDVVRLSALCLWLSLACFSVRAQSCSSSTPTSTGQFWPGGTSISIYIDPGFSGAEQTAIQQAVTNWFAQGGVSGNSITFSYVSSDPGTAPSGVANAIAILNDPSGSPNNLAFTSTNVSANNTMQTYNATIAFNRSIKFSDGTAQYNPNGAAASSFVTETFEHELGHAFGLNDITAPTDPSTGMPNACLETPGGSIMNGFCGTNDTGLSQPVGGTITACDKSVVASVIDAGNSSGGCSLPCTPGDDSECDKGFCSDDGCCTDTEDGGMAGDSGGVSGGQSGGDGGGGGGGDGGSCNEDGESCSSDSDCCEEDCTDFTCGGDAILDPIILDLTGLGYQLTSAANGVNFDFFGTGAPIKLSWTAAGWNGGFLALDLNGNGRIDSGKELFSNVAPQTVPVGKKANGFLALAYYDLPANGGNGDGWIDAQDAIFSKLVVWVDKNHNGVSDPGELLTLKQAGIQAISINYAPAGWKDVFGNLFRYSSQSRTNTSPNQVVYDVVLQRAGSGSTATAAVTSKK
jgi:hypothetical protein